MPRLARTESPTGYYHIMIRGNNREEIFKEIQEKRYYSELLQHQVNEEKIFIVAYCFMNNHVHLLIRSSLQEISEALKWININFAGRYNYKYERIGHVFQDRFKSEVIDTKKYLIQALRYIHKNPVKAKIVSKASEYKWSSYNNYMNKDYRLVDTDEKQMILELFSGSIEQFIKFHLEEDTREFLEVKVDLERERKEKAQNIIKKYQVQYGHVGVLDMGKEDLEEIILELLKKSRLTHRNIAELTGVKRSVVHRLAKKLRVVCE